MVERVKWWDYELKRLYRLYVKPEQSVLDLIHIVGVFWLWRKGAKREYRVWPWYRKRIWYSLDLALPSKQLGVEADGLPHQSLEGINRDIVREQRLSEKGWRILRITYEEMRRNPKGVRRRVRHFLSQK